MQIRNKLTNQFLGIVALILVISSFSVYYFASSYRKEDFYQRLDEKGRTTARLLIQVDEVDTTLLKIIDKNNLGSLTKEFVVIYNYKNQEIYSTDEDDYLKFDLKLLNEIRLEKEKRFTLGEFEVLGI